MALPASGTLSISDINEEFNRSGSAQTAMSQLYRGGGIVTANNSSVPTSGAIRIGQFYGARRKYSFTISENQTNANLRSLAVAAGWDQVSPLEAIIASGVIIGATSTSNAALTINGSYLNGVDLVNNGIIVGMGGKGGDGVISSSSPGLSGGTALTVAAATTITNNGTIAGGGGGGGSGGGRPGGSSGGVAYPNAPGGSGGGGRSSLTDSAPGVNPYQLSQPAMTGAAGTYAAGGAGGAGYPNVDGSNRSGPGGAGGDWGSPGATGVSSSAAGGAGGAAGAAVTGNINITWLVTGTRLGSVS